MNFVNSFDVVVDLSSGIEDGQYLCILDHIMNRLRAPPTVAIDLLV